MESFEQKIEDKNLVALSLSGSREFKFMKKGNKSHGTVSFTFFLSLFLPLLKNNSTETDEIKRGLIIL